MSKISISFESYPSLLPGTILNNRYKIIKELGEGRSAIVYSAVDTTSQSYDEKTVAVKVFRGGSYINDYEDEYHIYSLLKAGGSNNNKLCYLTDTFTHLIHYAGTKVTTTHACIVMPIMGEPISTLIKKIDDGLPTATVSLIMRQVLTGLQVMHAKNIIHTDIKPHNVLCTKPIANINSNSEIEVVLADFGSSCQRYNMDCATIGTAGYTSPEGMLKKKYDLPTDIWSIGCLCYYLMTGSHLFTYGGYASRSTLSNSHEEEGSNNEEESSNEESEEEIILEEEKIEEGPYQKLAKFGGSYTIDDINLDWTSSSSESESDSSSDSSDEEEDVLEFFVQCEELLGKAPLFIRKKYGREYFNSKGNIKGNPQLQPRSIEQRLAEFDIPDHECSAVGKWITSCLQYNPLERANVSLLLETLF